jgi:hypothetical protein
LNFGKKNGKVRVVLRQVLRESCLVKAKFNDRYRLIRTAPISVRTRSRFVMPAGSSFVVCSSYFSS